VREQVDAERALRAGGSAPAEGRRATPRVVEEEQPVGVTPTPAPALFVTDEVPWDESTRPTYPAPADASYTELQQAYPRHLIDIHNALRAELAQLRDVVEQVRQGLMQVGQARSVINTMTMRQNNWTLGAYCETYCRIVTGHHTLEDRSMFRHLKHVDPDAAPVVDRLAHEHEVIAGVLDRVDRALVGLVSAEIVGASAALEDFAATVDLLAGTLLSHLSYEERELLHPLAQFGLG
jgi:Hemerythrin HHE cation binding domain